MANTSEASSAKWVMEGASAARFRKMEPYLQDRPPRPLYPSYDEVQSFPQPENIDDKIRFNYTYDELVDIAHRYTAGSPDDIRRIMRYAIIWSGIGVDTESGRWATQDDGFMPGTRIPRVTMPVDGRRLSIRIVPDNWKDALSTPFFLKKTDRGMSIVAATSKGSPVNVAEANRRYITGSVPAIAHINNLEDGSTTITVNPLQKCPQECKFCCRAYYDMTAEQKSSLVNLKPREMARFLINRYGSQFPDWGKISQISIVTGEFPSATSLLRYVKNFVNEMRIATSGQWDPVVNPHQEIGIFTHLLDSVELMKTAKEIGMKHFLHTVEMVQDTREEVMHTAGGYKPSELNKGHAQFEDILRVLEAAVSVFGADNVEPVLVIGLDPLEQSKRAMDRIRELGITHLSRSLLNVYDTNQFGLMHVSFEDVVATIQYAKTFFKSSFNRVIPPNDQQSNRGEIV